MDSLRSYLKERGLTRNSPSEELANAKREHRRLYQKDYQAKRRKARPRIGVSLSAPERQQLSKDARRHGMKLPHFIRMAALAYTGKKYILPDDTTARALEIELRRIGNNINQVARRCNEKKTAEALDIEEANNLLIGLEDAVSAAFRNPREEP